MADRPEFREWVDRSLDPGWKLMPLTHVTSATPGEDIIRDGAVNVVERKPLGNLMAYFFYGRAAYRLPDDGVVKLAAACPFCFVFDPDLIKKAKAIFAFDTGAFEKRMYKHALVEDMKVDDFSLETDVTRPNKIIAKVFNSKRLYFEGDASSVKVDDIAEAYEFLAQSYLHLVTSRGRNEPDDRICSIEVVVGEPVPLKGNLLAIVVPHTLWDKTKAPWLEKLSLNGVIIKPYIFVPGRHPEYYHALLESAVRELFDSWNVF